MNEDEIIKRYKRLVYYVAFKYHVDEYHKEELISCCWLGFAKALKTYNKSKGTSFSTYVVFVMHNECKMYLREINRKYIPTTSLDSEVTDSLTYNDLLGEEDERLSHRYDNLYTAINYVTKKYNDKKKQIISLFMKDLTFRQISNETNISLGYVQRIVAKFKDDLKKVMINTKGGELCKE